MPNLVSQKFNKLIKSVIIFLLVIIALPLSSCTNTRIINAENKIESLYELTQSIDKKNKHSIEIIDEILEFDDMHNSLDKNNRIKLEEVKSWLDDISDSYIQSLNLRIEELEYVLSDDY